MTKAGTFIAALALSASGCTCGLVPQIEGAPCDTGNVCPDGYLCTSGFCHGTQGSGGGSGGGTATGGGGGANLCEGVTCTMPPASSCVNTSTLRTFTGTCQPASGSCNYAPMDTHCEQGCMNGMCIGDACAGMTCTTPPAPHCSNNSLVTAASPGSCTSGMCKYTESSMDCGAGGCMNGMCVGAGQKFTQTLPRVRHEVTAIDQAPGSMGNNVVVVGPGGMLTAWNGTTWTPAPPLASAADLESIWFPNQNSALVVSARGLLKWNGTALTAVAGFPSVSGGITPIDVHGKSESDYVVVADDATVYHFSSGGWTTTTQSSLSGPYVANGVFVDEAGHIAVYGSCNSSQCVIYSKNGTSYSVHNDNSGTFSALGPALDAPNNSNPYLWAGSASEAVRRFDSSAVVFFFDSNDVPTLTGDGAVVRIVGATANGMTAARANWVLTTQGTNTFGSLYRVTLSGSTATATPLANVFYDVQTMTKTDSAGVVFVDTNSTTGGNTIVRRSATVDEALDVGAEEWVAVAPAGSGFVMLNKFGDVAGSLGAPTFQLHRTTDSITALDVASGSSYAVFVGSSNSGSAALAQKVPLTPGSTYVDLNVPNAPGQLNGICRVSDSEWYVVGDSGSAYKFDGSTLTEMTTPTGENLMDVDCGGTSGVAIACGDNGTVLKLTNGAWSSVTQAPQANFTSCRLVGSTVYVAADGTFAKYSGGTWTSLATRPTLNALVAVSGTEIYGISGGTAIYRFNGSSWSLVTTAPQALVGGGLVAGHVMYAGKAGVVMEGQ